jgi:hypothetical protein
LRLKILNLFAAPFGFQQVIQEKGVPFEVAGGKAVKSLTDSFLSYF